MAEHLHELHVLNRSDIYRNVKPIINKENFENLETNSSYMGFIAELQNEPVGYIIAKIKITPENSALIKHKTIYRDELFVYKEQRGKNIGKKLFYSLESKGKELGIERIDLTVWSFNVGATNFYRSCGWIYNG